MKFRILLLAQILVISFNSFINAQETDGNIFGDVQSNGEHIPFVNIYLEDTNTGTTTDHTGHYMLVNLPIGKHTIVVQAIGYRTIKKEILIEQGKSMELNFVLEEDVISMEGVVITGTKTFKRQTESPVIVNVLDSKMINMIQVNTLSEGLCFQPGLRMETDCQTCNYSQLRMNGLGGSYSQILINSRPVFSPLTGLYGLEQIPANMIDRIEVVRGGASALYGSGAIGGTVNVLTKIPDRNAYEFSVNNSIIDGSSNDNLLNGNLNVISSSRNSGVSFFASRREREAYDHNADNFSELPQLKSNSFGLTSFFKPKHNHKLELNFSSLYEYRFGGEMVDRAAHLAQQAEERTHNVFMGGLDYQIDLNNQKSSFIGYAGYQNTKRKHYTGIIPDAGDEGYNEHFLKPPYGNSKNYTAQFGVQFNHNLEEFLGGSNQLTFGAEHVHDDIFDQIEAYNNYELDQITDNTGAFIQSDWNVAGGLTILTGVRADKHNMVDNIIFSPRVSALYKLKRRTQFRLSWSTGFKAPQAFDSDMHMAFAGGGVSRIILDEDLKEERSRSISASINFDMPTENYIYGFTIEGFSTKLNDAFVIRETDIPSDYGIIYQKVNGSASNINGASIELRGNLRKKIQLETGYTIQSSAYSEAEEYAPGIIMKEYLRTPEQYGYYTLTYTPSPKFNASLSGTYTGSMKLIHVLPDESSVLVNTDSFLETSVKLAYTLGIKSVDSKIELFGGVKNLTNAYQNDFDKYKSRDSNYIYGPATPRTVYFGVKIKSF
jgi:outer membrane receptor for ferrienterochelin and colicins